jgi:transcriptional antiterminator NusG
MKPLSSAFSKEVLQELARPVEPTNPRYAEIVGGRSPRWHVVEVYASMQADIAADLAHHRYGVYVPEVDETIIKRGHKIDRRVPMFSGYIFVFMWQADQNWQWITSTPGVVAILGELSDEEIDIVRKVENTKRPIVIALAAPSEVEPEPQTPARTKSKKKRGWKKRTSRKSRPKAVKPRIITEADLRNEIITTRAWSAFDDLIVLDSEGRNQTLRKALGLS